MPRLRPVSEPKDPNAEVKKPELFEAPGDAPDTVERFEPVEEKEPVKEQTENDTTLALKKQIEELKKSEELQRSLAEKLRRDHDAAIQMAAQQTRKVEKSHKEILDGQEIALEKTIQAAKSDAEKALLDYKNALDLGDNAAAVEAMDRITDAKANMRAFERDMEQVKIQRKELKKERKKQEDRQEAKSQPQLASSNDPVDSFDLPPAEKNWVKNHREYITNPEKAAELEFIHKKTMFKGLKPGDPGYLTEIENGLVSIGSLAPRQEERRTSIVSAPVSREAPSSGGRNSGKISLTPEQREFARISGVTEAEYAKQLMKMNEMKANGELQGERR